MEISEIILYNKGRIKYGICQGSYGNRKVIHRRRYSGESNEQNLIKASPGQDPIRGKEREVELHGTTYHRGSKQMPELQKTDVPAGMPGEYADPSDHSNV